MFLNSPTVNILGQENLVGSAPPVAPDGANQIVAQTSASPLVQPMSRKRYNAILASQQAERDRAQAKWDALGPLVQLEVQIKVAEDDKARAMSQYRDTDDHQWLRKAQDIHKKIVKLQHDHHRHALAEAFRAKYKK